SDVRLLLKREIPPGPAGIIQQSPRGNVQLSSKLLELDGSASFFQLSLSSFSIVLACAFEDSLRCALYELLSFLQAQAGNEFTDSLNDADLLCASVGQDNVKLVLLFFSSSSVCTWCSSNSSYRSSSGYVEDLFEFLNELGEFDEGHFLERFNELVLGELSHGRHPFCSRIFLNPTNCCCGAHVVCDLSFLLLLQCSRKACNLRSRGIEQASGLCQVALHCASQLCESGLAVVQVGDSLDLVSRQCAAVHVAALDNKCFVVIGELLHNLCSVDCFALDEGESGWAGEVFVKAQVGAQLLKRCNRQAAVLGDNDGRGFSDLFLQLSQLRSVLWVCHFLTRLLSKHLFCSAGANLMTGIKKAPCKSTRPHKQVFFRLRVQQVSPAWAAPMSAGTFDLNGFQITYGLR